MTNQQRQHYAKGGIATLRQPYFLGKAVKKITRGAKKVLKSPLGKAALIGGLGWAANAGKLGGMGQGWFPKFKGLFKEGALLGNLLHTGKGAERQFSLGKAGLMGLLGAGATLPFLGGEEEEMVEETPWDVTPTSIASIKNMARMRDPSLSFMPSPNYVQSGFYLADGGRAGLMNGGGAAEAQAETMLKMEYQKYRNQGGTMSYQQFKMAVLQQAQAQGPMAQGQRQMAQEGGLMDLGGMEKDYRNDGGFVPLGEEERADDVPARLSKNEFVFTADAVRAAGGGDVDAGAEVMENMMNNLEAGGQISEESQGQGAQRMYDTMTEQETRVA